MSPTSILSRSPISLPPPCSQSFSDVGFVAIDEPFLSPSFVKDLRHGLERLIRGDYDRPEGKRGGGLPDKPCRVVKAPMPGGTNAQGREMTEPLGFSGNHANVRTLQVVNCWKASSVFERLVLSPELGEYVSRLTGWSSVRVIQDQSWLKPPSAGELAFHRDRGYFMFQKSAENRACAVDAAEASYKNGLRVVTVWIALDDMDGELGPIEYVKGSHRWGRDGVDLGKYEGNEAGTNSKFFNNDDYRYMARRAAAHENVDAADVEFVVMDGVPSGGGTVHDGDTWHGSAANRSRTRCRRGVGIHYIRGEVDWDVGAARHSKLWKPYVEAAAAAGDARVVDDEHFPIVFRREKCPSV
eukprot:CAMPEP_0194288326 /NCGR_PEP_ID=MMETSP0169-20130528/36563_1 /TAXON_ID=218684 /ORGANISM="Corethron pennatum, Strain L29A3" /LENGTH=354 /DNA_ID=CAMNT_0039035293 /DNA_START=101 /DNA_END=1165 /DNA_ORIENTATION=-